MSGESIGKASLQEALIRFERARSKYLQYRDNLIGPIEGKEIDKKLHVVTVDADMWRSAKAELKQELDRLVVTWRDVTHEAMMSVGVNSQLIHAVMSNQDDFLNRSKE